jgi:hypothetical protein
VPSKPRIASAILAATALALAIAAPASAARPDRWVLTGASSVPNTYWQGLTSDPARENVFFVGTFEGLWRTTPELAETAGAATAIPPSVEAQEGYNHIGDPTWNETQGGVVLPFECYTPGIGNFCGTGSFGVADPDTLALRYYVKLDPADIPKAMWAETSPDGSLVWTSSGEDLLAYRSSEISRANRAPAGPMLKPARRLEGAVPPSGITGAVFRGEHHLLLAGEGEDTHQVWSVDTDSGASRLVLERPICGESEGLDVIPTLGGKLHWLIAPFDPGCELSFGPSSALLHFARSRGHRRYDVNVLNLDFGAIPGEVTAKFVVSRDRPIAGAQVNFAGATGRTNDRGIVKLTTTLQRPGRFKALARKHRRWGASDFVQLGEPEAVGRVARNGAA